MKKWLKTLIVIGIIALVLFAIFRGTYNGFVAKEGQVTLAKGDIQVQLQRRADLIPNFVRTVQGYTDYEKETLTAITEARAAVKEAQTPDQLDAAEEKLNGAIDVWVNAVTEAYPDLKANQNYIALQDELAGTENRIAKARSDYNEKATKYNVAIRRFPANIVAKIFGFNPVDLFEASEGAENVPQVSFE